MACGCNRSRAVSAPPRDKTVGYKVNRADGSSTVVNSITEARQVADRGDKITAVRVRSS